MQGSHLHDLYEVQTLVAKVMLKEAGALISSGVLMEVQSLNALVEFHHVLVQAGQWDPRNPHSSQNEVFAVILDI